MNIYERIINILLEYRLDESNRSEAHAEGEAKEGRGRETTQAKVKGREERYDAPGTFPQNVKRMSGGKGKGGKPAPLSRKQAHMQARGEPTRGAPDKPVIVTDPRGKSIMARLMLQATRKPQIP